MQNNRLIVLALILQLSLAGCSTPKKSTIPPLTITYSVATTQKLSDMIWFSSSTEAISSAIIEPRVNGYLTSINYSDGKPVEANELLYTINPDQLELLYAEAMAAKESAEASLTEARNNFLRAEPMANINAISRSSLDQYRANYIAAEAQLSSAKQSLRNAELNLSYATIKAPIGGIIASSSVSVGDYVGPGTQYTTLTTIEDIDTLQIALAIPTSTYLRHATPSRSYNNEELLSNIEVRLSDSTIYPHLASYAYTQQGVSASNSAIVLVVNVANPDQQLKSGMFVRIKANIGKPHPQIVIPQSAVTQLQGINSVWVIDADSTVHRQSVTLGKSFGNMWSVEAGIKSGQMVATSGQLKLHDGAKVNPQIK